MNDDNSDENDLEHDDQDDYQSSIQNSKNTPTIPFANFYTSKGTTSSTSLNKLSEQLANTSSKIPFRKEEDFHWNFSSGK